MSFTLGEDSSDSSDTETDVKETQTDFSFLATGEEDAAAPEVEREARDLQTCVEIMKSEV